MFCVLLYVFHVFILQHYNYIDWVYTYYIITLDIKKYIDRVSQGRIQGGGGGGGGGGWGGCNPPFCPNSFFFARSFRGFWGLQPPLLSKNLMFRTHADSTPPPPPPPPPPPARRIGRTRTDPPPPLVELAESRQHPPLVESAESGQHHPPPPRSSYY